jgi:pyruvate formate-lyase activating enzyme-like uncharacterized protein
MQLVDFRDIVLEKARRQSLIKGLEVHAHGHCVHVGKISFACGWCFSKKEMFQLSVGNQCQCRANCPSCFFGSCADGQPAPSYRDNLSDLYALGVHFDWKPEIFSYNSWGETLLALAGPEQGVFLRAAEVLKLIEERHNYKIYKKLYTNGLLANADTLAVLKDELDITEIRFHPSASMFSETVYGHMETAKAMGFVVVVEEPSLPHHRKQLFEMLPRLEAIGAKHLDICEVEITRNNIQRLHELFPDGRMYKNMAYHLYDEGLVYDLIEEVLRRNYTYSVIDCSSDRERFARSRRDEGLDLEDLQDVLASPWDSPA